MLLVCKARLTVYLICLVASEVRLGVLLSPFGKEVPIA